MNTATAVTRRGRKRLCSDRTLEYVVDLHRAGVSLRGIAARLNDEGVRTPSGGVRWHHSYVDGLLHTHGGRAMLEARSALYPVPPAPTDLTPPGAQAIAHTEKAATSCRSKKTLRPGQTRKSLSAEADVATFSRRSCSVGKVTDKQGRTDRLSGGAVARRTSQPDLPRFGIRLCGNDVRTFTQRLGMARVVPDQRFEAHRIPRCSSLVCSHPTICRLIPLGSRIPSSSSPGSRRPTTTSGVVGAQASRTKPRPRCRCRSSRLRVLFRPSGLHYVQPSEGRAGVGRIREAPAYSPSITGSGCWPCRRRHRLPMSSANWRSTRTSAAPGALYSTSADWSREITCGYLSTICCCAL